ncbi:MAG: CRISPR-associated helicase Cas3' [Candidatus Micrarchaeaceae archaeon]
MSYSFKLISHPQSDSDQIPRLLKTHLAEVGTCARDLIHSLPISDLSISGEKISHSQLEELAYIIGISHDFGKSTSFFQEYLRTQLKKEESRHAFISALLSFYLTEKNIPRSPLLSYIAFFTVYYHHGDLETPATNSQRLDRNINIAKKQALNILNESFDEVKEIYESLLPGSSSILKEFLENDGITRSAAKIKRYIAKMNASNGFSFDTYFIIMLMYSVLLYADKISASGIGYENATKDRKSFEIIPRSLVDKYKEELKIESRGTPELNALRDTSYSEALESLKTLDIKDTRMLRLELPTGFGKTTTAFGIALELRERIQKELGSTPRIIYALPFISIIDQNFDVFQKILSQSFGSSSNDKNVPSSLLLRHHHLSDIYFTFKNEEKLSDTDSVDPHDLEKRYLLMESWNSEIIVTTFVQLFHTLITNRNSSSMKFHSLVNSIIILDEVQAIPYKYQALVIEMFRELTSLFNSWVIMMTATMPYLFLQNMTTNIIPESRKYFDKMNRVIYKFIPTPMDLDTLVKIIMQREGKDILIVVNTIQASKELYESLKNSLSLKYGNPKWKDEIGYCDFGSVMLTNLSSNLTPADREKRIDAIKELKCNKIIVSTQLIEAGVDIDMDIVIRDIAPVDSIVQAAGRANRESIREKGEVLIVTLKDTNGKKYAGKIYDQVDLTQSDDILKKAFSGDSLNIGLSEKQLHDAVISYYNALVDTKSDKDSKDMIQLVGNLNYDRIQEFKWVEEKFPKVDIFVPINKDAELVWDEYENAMKLLPLERKKKLLTLRNRLYMYVISVSAEYFDTNEPLINPVVSYGKSIDDFYDKETGFRDIKFRGGPSYANW